MIKNKLSVLLNLVLVLLIVGVSISGYFTYISLNKITERLEQETKPNNSFIYYKDIIILITELEDLVTSDRIKEKENFTVAFQDKVERSLNLIDSVQTLKLEDQQHQVLTDSLSNLFDQYIYKLADLQLLKDELISQAFNDLNEKITKLDYSAEPRRETIGTSAPDSIVLPKDSLQTVPKQPEEEKDKRSFFQRLFGNKEKKEEEKELAKQPTVDQPATDTVPDSVLRNLVKADTVKRDVQKLIGQVKEETAKQINYYTEQELALTSEVSTLRLQMVQLLDFLSSREILLSKRNTVAAKELILKTNQQTFLFSILVTTLLIITVIILFVFTKRNARYNHVLRIAKGNAERLAKSKERFLANMSHEIRTPLNAIVGFTEQLAKTKQDETQREYTDIIHNASDHLMKVINDILDFTKLEYGKLELHRVPFNLYKLLEESISLLRFKAEEKGISLISNIEETPYLVSGDPHRLKQVILNLVHNSIKFTELGGITITTAITKVSNEKILLEFSIKDTGQGIPKSHQKRIFKDFEQSDSSASSQGTGLGLSIVKRIVDLHQGELGLTSEPGKGTEIKILLPYEKVKGSVEDVIEKPSLKKYDLSNISVLIADDEPYNLKLLRAILGEKCKNIIACEDGKQALDLLRKEKVDLALLDIKMPALSGWEIIKAIRNSSGVNQEIPVLALTATVDAQIQQKAISNGFNGVLSKPFTEYELISLMAKNLEMKPIEKLPEKEKKQNGARIFAIDSLLQMGDQAFVNDMLQTYVESSEYNWKAFNKAYTQKNLTELANSAHKIVAPSRHLEVDEFVGAMKQVEQEALEGVRPSEQFIDKLDFQYNELIHAIKKYLKEQQQ